MCFRFALSVALKTHSGLLSVMECSSAWSVQGSIEDWVFISGEESE